MYLDIIKNGKWDEENCEGGLQDKFCNQEYLF